jgi:hypothetical protein
MYISIFACMLDTKDLAIGFGDLMVWFILFYFFVFPLNIFLFIFLYVSVNIWR